ncbi:MAG: bifunctional pyr operon transcriptional regulator/uracil phosphoribosyltransferase [Desulfobacca sp. 4484_104]|nr:MAG: bifunctional pyr operon transcriptional regulator/uracil phosphoribosyltransferase [Desulfobacca sp. 4484_104]RLA90075.1 MAG: bifunctional pyr operon transcriptional regulator/uracil phosphoribosyltransferase PyrR [Deltaproteobacteria bacterium]
MNCLQRSVTMNAVEFDQTVERLTADILSTHPDLSKLVLVGIRTGGAFLAQRLGEKINQQQAVKIPVGILDITLYRDDWTRISHKPQVGRTELPFSIDDQDVVLVDDVLFTGRTVRAALDALIDFGRPRRIRLAVLVDRGGRELPISADFIGQTLELSVEQRVNVYFREMQAQDEVAIESANLSKK